MTRISMTRATLTTCATPLAAMTSVVGRYWSLIFVLSLVSLASAACSQEAAPLTKDQILSRAHDALEAGQYVSAEKDYREVLRQASNNPIALRQLGALYLEQGEPLQGYPLLTRAAQLQPQDMDVQLKLAQAAKAIVQVAQAREAAQVVLDNKPGNEAALLVLVETARSLDEIQQTQKLIEGLREKDEDRAGYHLAFGILDMQRKDDAGAESEFKAALKMDPKSSATYSALGALYFRQNNRKAADEAMKTSADLSPLRSSMQIRYVDYKLLAGALPEAKAILEDINSKFPEYLPPRVYLMTMACNERRDDDCAARVKSILAQAPESFDAVYQDSLLSLTKGDDAKAIRELEYLRNIYQQNPQVAFQLAVAYLASAGDASPVDFRKAIDNAEGRLRDALRLEASFEPAILLYADLEIRKGSAAVVIEPLAQLVKGRPQNAKAQYLLASAYLAERRGNEALAVLRQVEELFPKDPQAPFGVGKILVAQGERSEARKEFEKSLSISADYLPATEELANLDLTEKNYAAAMDRVQKQIEKNATAAPLLVLRGKIYIAQQDIAHAEADLRRAIELDPKLEPAYALLAQLYVSSNRQDQAIEKLNGFVEKNKTVPALMQLAAIHEQMKNFSAARDAYEKLLTVSAEFAPALNNLAVLYSEHLGDLDKAYELAKKARQAAPSEPSMADTLGWIMFKKADYGNALPLLQEAAAKLADRPIVQFHVGMVNYMLGNETAARLALQKVADASADGLEKDEARERLAVLSIDIGTADAAVRKELDSFLQRRPNDPVALARFAQLQLRDGAADQAVKTFEKIVVNSPLYRPALRQLALLYGERSTDAPKAYELVQTARQAYPNDADIAKTLGVLTYRRELYPRSAELLQEAAKTRKDDPEVFYYLGAAQYALKQWNECKVTLARALSLNLSTALEAKAKQSFAACSEAAKS
jgi:tetratricopeptide (TPR) repeat protein